MILVDTSVWIDHLRAGDATLVSLLNAGQVLVHPYVIGELALGSLSQRNVVLESLKNLPQACIASDEEVMAFIEQNALFGLGIGYIDASLLASTLLTPGSKLWTRDKRLTAIADRMNIQANHNH